MASHQSILSWVSPVLTCSKSSLRLTADQILLPGIKRLLQVLSLIMLFPSIDASDDRRPTRPISRIQTESGTPQATQVGKPVLPGNLHPDVKIIRSPKLITISDSGHYDFIAREWGWVAALVILVVCIWLTRKNLEEVAEEVISQGEMVKNIIVNGLLGLTFIVIFIRLAVSGSVNTVILNLELRQMCLKVEHHYPLFFEDSEDTLCLFDEFLAAQAFPQAVVFHWSKPHGGSVVNGLISTCCKREVMGSKTNSSSEADKPYKFYRDFRDAINAEMTKLGIEIEPEIANEEWFELWVDNEGNIDGSRSWTVTRHYR